MITTTCKALLPVCYHNEEGLQPYPNPLPEELWTFAPHVEGPPGLEWAFLEASMLLDDPGWYTDLGAVQGIEGRGLGRGTRGEGPS